MKISGRRADGALYLSMGAGVAVILLGDRVSPPLDDEHVTKLGPWTPGDNSLAARRMAERLLDRARVTSLSLMSFKQADPPTDPPADPPAVSEVAEAAQDADAASPKPKKSATAPMEPVVPADPAADRKEKRSALRDKIRVGLKSQHKVESMLSDEEVSDDDLYAMAKALGITDAEHPGAVKLTEDK